MNRVAAFVIAIATAIAELSSAISTITQAPPQYLWPRTNAGSSDELAKLSMWSVPQPVIWPHETNTSKTPRMMMQPITPRGIVFFGSSLSSPSGAAASQPEMAKMANTTPRKSACMLGALPGLTTARLTPPAPGSRKPEIARASTISVSMTPRTTTSPVESSMPRYAVTATRMIRKTMKYHHLKSQPYSAFSVPCSVSPMNEPTWATTTG